MWPEGCIVSPERIEATIITVRRDDARLESDPDLKEAVYRAMIDAFAGDSVTRVGDKDG